MLQGTAVRSGWKSQISACCTMSCRLMHESCRVAVSPVQSRAASWKAGYSRMPRRCSGSWRRCQRASGTAKPQVRSAFIARVSLKGHASPTALLPKQRTWLTCEVKATEKSRMMPETMDSESWIQKLIQPICRVEFAAVSSARLATSETGIAAFCEFASCAAALTCRLCTALSGHFRLLCLPCADKACKVM